MKSCGIILLVLALAAITLQAQQPIDEVGVTYLSIVRASRAGANTTALISQLNDLINLALNRGERIDLSKLANMRKESVELADLAHNEALWGNLAIALFLTASILLMAAAYYYLFVKGRIWRVWLKIRGKQALKVRKERVKRSSMLLDDEVRAVLAAILVVAVVFAVAQYISAGKVAEPFSELGLLGRNKKLADYPSNLTVGERALVYIYVGNHMGYPMFYEVEAKLGNKSSKVNSSSISPFWHHYLILEYNKSKIIPLTFSLNKTGTYKLIVELWAYNETSRGFRYDGRWTQLWVNVASPAP